MALPNKNRLPSVVTPNPSGTGSTKSTLAGTTSKPFAQLTDMQDPQSLLRIINQLASTAHGAATSANARHDAGYTLFKAITFTPGQDVVISHGIGAPYQGWTTESARPLSGGALASSFGPVVVPPTPTHPADQYIVLRFSIGSTAVVADVKVW
jgi:hypothetical protein